MQQGVLATNKVTKVSSIIVRLCLRQGTIEQTNFEKYLYNTKLIRPNCVPTEYRRASKVGNNYYQIKKSAHPHHASTWVPFPRQLSTKAIKKLSCFLTSDDWWDMKSSHTGAILEKSWQNRKYESSIMLLFAIINLNTSFNVS